MLCEHRDVLLLQLVEADSISLKHLALQGMSEQHLFLQILHSSKVILLIVLLLLIFRQHVSTQDRIAGSCALFLEEESCLGFACPEQLSLVLSVLLHELGCPERVRSVLNVADCVVLGASSEVSSGRSLRLTKHVLLHHLQSKGPLVGALEVATSGRLHACTWIPSLLVARFLFSHQPECSLALSQNLVEIHADEGRLD